jgi:2,5-diamino-6-(ribosylamino)-4(3H)-pyrimidinone 5'-phosphate reductase
MKSRRTKKPSALPFVFLNVASTADGKLAPSNRNFVPFSSKRDRDLMMELRATADAVMSGARTLDLFPATLGPGGKKYREQRIKRGLREYNLRVIVSGSASIDPAAEIFKHKFSPIVLLTRESAPADRLSKLKSMGVEIGAFGERELDFTAALRWLREKWKVKRLLCEGGGEVNAALFRENLVDEIHLTLCPVIFGGRNAPTMADGDGIQKLADATPLKLKSMERVGDELFLVYRVQTAFVR